MTIGDFVPPTIANYLASISVWVTAAVWIAFFYCSGRYIASATKLAVVISTNHTELWSKLNSRFFPGLTPYYVSRKAQRLESLVLFNSRADDHPDDPEFRRLLRASRVYAFACLITFVAAITMLGLTFR